MRTWKVYRGTKAPAAATGRARARMTGYWAGYRGQGRGTFHRHLRIWFDLDLETRPLRIYMIAWDTVHAFFESAVFSATRSMLVRMRMAEVSSLSFGNAQCRNSKAVFSHTSTRVHRRALDPRPALDYARIPPLLVHLPHRRAGHQTTLPQLSPSPIAEKARRQSPTLTTGHHGAQRAVVPKSALLSVYRVCIGAQRRRFPGRNVA